MVFIFELTKRFGFLQPSTEDEAPEAAKVTAAATTPSKVPKSVSDKKRFFESAMEDQHKPTQKTGECQGGGRRWESVKGRMDVDWLERFLKGPRNLWVYVVGVND